MSCALDAWVQVFQYITTVDHFRLECVCKQFKNCLRGNDKFWQKQCLQRFCQTELVGPRQEPCQNYKQVFGCWYSQLKDLDEDIVARACRAWKQIETWLLQNNMQELYQSLNQGCDKRDMDHLEQQIGMQLPQSLKAIYRIHNGQCAKFAQQGLLGSYCFYNYAASTIMSTLIPQNFQVSTHNVDILWMALGISEFPSPRKFLLLNCFSGDMFISDEFGTDQREQLQSFCPANPPGGTGKNDGVLCWFEEYAKRLSSNVYRVDTSIARQLWISLYPRKTPLMSRAVTHGIQVEASVVFAPEHCKHLRQQGGKEKLFGYSIRMKMVKETEEFKQAQLVSRLWVVYDGDGSAPEHVEGAGVVGKYPIVAMDQEEFVYQSCTMARESGGYMYGTFTFVQGTIAQPTGPKFEVECPRFDLNIPEFVY
eukprot:TRINITY_DN23863_c1_g1_i1.p1 TRINITY_DN23863_c1_g1~~TRINITY_DN23863_c1_g1_i1.p1  ORF type:complete len:423 (-),score=30.10 TRINITY_DN23863_c1_g1_i1:427-1695(-)